MISENNQENYQTKQTTQKEFLDTKIPEDNSLYIKKGTLRHNYYRLLRFRYFKCWRIISLLSGYFIMLIGGSIFSWSSYNRALREEMDYTYSELNILFSIGLFGVYFSFLSGFLFDKFGPRGTLIYAFIFGTIGYLLFALQVTSKFTTNAFVSCVFFFIATQGCGALLQTSVQTSTHNFHQKIRATVIGFMTSGFPLSGSLYSIIYTHYFKNMEGGGVHDYLFFLCAVTCIGSFIGMIVMFVVPAEDIHNTSYGKVSVSTIDVADEEEEKRLLSSTSFVGNKIPVEAILANQEMSKTERAIYIEDYQQDIEPAKTEEITISYNEKKSDIIVKPQTALQVKKAPKFPLLQVFKNVDFYICIIAIALAGGPSLNFISNCSLILASNDVDEKRIDTLAILTSVFHACGRFMFGCLADIVAKIGITKPMMMSILSFILLTFFTLLVFYQNSLAQVIMWLEPWFLGGVLGSGPALISEKFGIKTFGFNLGVTLTIVAISNIFISTITGMLYDSHLDARGICTGEICFHHAFIISALMLLCSFSLYIFLIVKDHFKNKNKK